jgi:hypothetical protein
MPTAQAIAWANELQVQPLPLLLSSADISVYRMTLVFRVVLPPDLRDLIQDKGITLPLKWWTRWGGRAKQKQRARKKIYRQAEVRPPPCSTHQQFLP